jgi:hypothetical protein
LQGADEESWGTEVWEIREGSKSGLGFVPMSEKLRKKEEVEI